MQLSAPPVTLSLAPIHIIKKNLDRIFGKDKWVSYELETISLELGYVFDDLTRDKISILQLLTGSLDLFNDDVLFFLHAVNVINNSIADFDTFPLPTSLEIAYAYEEVKKTFPERELKFTPPIERTVKYILTLEGYSEPIYPFNQFGLKSIDFEKGQTEDDTKNKGLAIKKYIEAMNG